MVFKLLLLSVSGVTVDTGSALLSLPAAHNIDVEYASCILHALVQSAITVASRQFLHCVTFPPCRSTVISPGLTLNDASTSSGIVWTLPCGGGVQAVLPPVVQHQAVLHCLLQVSLISCLLPVSLLVIHTRQTLRLPIATPTTPTSAVVHATSYIPLLDGPCKSLTASYAVLASSRHLLTWSPQATDAYCKVVFAGICTVLYGPRKQLMFSTLRFLQATDAFLWSLQAPDVFYTALPASNCCIVCKQLMPL